MDIDSIYLNQLSRLLMDGTTIEQAKANDDWALSLLYAGLFNRDHFLQVAGEFVNASFKNEENRDSFLLYIFFKSFVNVPELLATLTAKEKIFLEENWFHLLAYILNVVNENNIQIIQNILVQYGKYFQESSLSGGNKAQINFILALLPVDLFKFSSSNILYFIIIDIYTYILERKIFCSLLIKN